MTAARLEQHPQRPDDRDDREHEQERAEQERENSDHEMQQQPRDDQQHDRRHHGAAERPPLSLLVHLSLERSARCDGAPATRRIFRRANDGRRGGRAGTRTLPGRAPFAPGEGTRHISMRRGTTAVCASLYYVGDSLLMLRAPDAALMPAPGRMRPRPAPCPRLVSW